MSEKSKKNVQILTRGRGCAYNIMRRSIEIEPLSGGEMTLTRNRPCDLNMHGKYYIQIEKQIKCNNNNNNKCRAVPYRRRR